MIVFGVCASESDPFIVVPSIARSPEQIGVPEANDEPTNRAGRERNRRVPASQPPRAGITIRLPDGRRPFGDGLEATSRGSHAESVMAMSARPGKPRPNRSAPRTQNRRSRWLISNRRQ